MRVSRPIGLTMLSMKYNQTKDDTYLDNMRRLLIREYVSEGFKLFGNQMNLGEIANYLGINEEGIQSELAQLTGNITISDRNEAIGAMLFRLNFWALQDRSNTLKQMALLTQSQGKKFKPFVSQTVNQAIDLTMKSTKNLIDLYKAINPGPQIAISNHLEASQIQQNNLLSVEKAIGLIEQSGLNHTLSDPAIGQGLYEAYNIGSIPEVVATAQNKDEIAEYEDSGTKAKSIIKSHTTRRLDEYEINERDLGMD